MDKRKKNLLIVIASVLAVAIIALVVCLTVVPNCSKPDGTDNPSDTGQTGDNGSETGGNGSDDKEEKPDGENTGNTPPDGGNENGGNEDGNDKEEENPPHVHDYKETVVSPTCVERGYTTYLCHGCGDSYVDDYTDATGHTEETVAGTPATCLRAGKTDGLACAVCKEILKVQTETEPLGHAYFIYACIRCGALDPNMPESQGLKFEYSYSTDSYTLTGIGDCTDKTIKVPAQYKDKPVTAIGPYALTYSGAKHVSLPDSITEIKDHAFSTCSNLISVNLPAGVTIGESAFAACYKLENVKIPDGTTTIGNYAFLNCTSLKSVAFGKDVNSYGIDAFDRCDALEAFEVSPENTRYCSCDGILYNKAQTYMSIIPAALRGDITIPDTVLSVKSFKSNTNITSVKLPVNLTEINSSLFDGCTSLKSVTIPDGVKTIGSSAFNNCSALENLNIPDSVTSIAALAFNGTSLYKTENGIRYVGNWVIGRENGITDVVLPDSVKGIADQAFYGCKTLESIVIPEGVTAIGIWEFYNCTALKTITIPESVTSFANSAFSSCSSLTDIYYGGSKASWNAIKKADYWNSSTGNYTVHCADGDIVK